MRLLSLIAAALWMLLMLLMPLIGCSSPPTKSPEHGTRGPAPAGKAKPKQIVGEAERSSGQLAETRRIRIWGKVHHIIQNEHGELPRARQVSAGGVGDPVTEIRNVTPFKLTLWFAGTCSHQTEVKPASSTTVVFCPGTYHIAAEVEEKEYLPLVRENQEFKAGMRYILQVVVKQRPK
jgi:hypothetical protein